MPNERDMESDVWAKSWVVLSINSSSGSFHENIEDNITTDYHNQYYCKNKTKGNGKKNSPKLSVYRDWNYFLMEKHRSELYLFKWIWNHYKNIISKKSTCKFLNFSWPAYLKVIEVFVKFKILKLLLIASSNQCFFFFPSPLGFIHLVNFVNKCS